MQNISNYIKKQIHSNGPITFNEYMDTVLYDKKFGYYTTNKQKKINVFHDYFTSPQVHPSFSLLISVLLQNINFLLNKKNIRILEEGAGEGILARDISKYVNYIYKNNSDIFSYDATDKISSDNYWKIENINKKITKKYDIYLSNELIDSFPVHRFRIRSNKIKEIFVGIKNNQLIELEFPSLNDEINKRISPLINTLPEGYTGEVCDEYNSWAKRISVLVPSGVLISIDYGYEKSEFYDPSRKNGLLRCYDQNTINQNPFLKPGKQDITTHVDFTSVNEELNKLGIKKIFDISQYELLKKLGIENLIDDLENQYINNKINKKVYQQNLNAIYILTNPNGLGKFRVLLHSTKDLYDKLNKSKNKIFKKINDIQCPIITKNNEYINFLSISKKDDNIIENKTWKEIFDL